MKPYILAYDFGTGGIKASLYNEEGKSLAASFEAYATFYPQTGLHEQRPSDWLNALEISTKKLLSETDISGGDVEALAISGHSLGVVPISKDGSLLREFTPIWSDSRAQREAKEFFDKNSREEWYMTTGNGFPPHLYSAFKVMWYKNNEPESFGKIYKILGTKDYINYLLTGEIATDYSYASGSGFYDLKEGEYSSYYLNRMDLDESLFPDIVSSYKIIGSLTRKAAEKLNLSRDVKVACGGVDNSCMALGAKCTESGRAYVSLGSSAWNVVSGEQPVLDFKLSPFVFASCIEGLFVSATSIFSAGSSLQWVRNQICKNLLDQPTDAYVLMNELAATSPVGANKLLFNPSLAGGTGADATPNMRGAYMGLDLKHNQADLIRSAMEGIALALRVSLDYMREMTELSDEILFVGGGAKSPLWLDIFADVYQMNVIKTDVGQEAGSLGAAALAAVGSGMWNDFSQIDKIHKIEEIHKPDEKRAAEYNKILKVYEKASEYLAKISDDLYNLKLGIL